MDRTILSDKLAQCKVFGFSEMPALSVNDDMFRCGRLFGCYFGILDGSNVGFVNRQFDIHFNWSGYTKYDVKVITDLNIRINPEHHIELITFFSGEGTTMLLPVGYFDYRIRGGKLHFVGSRDENLVFVRKENGDIAFSLRIDAKDKYSDVSDTILFAATLTRHDDFQKIVEMIKGFGTPR